MENNTTIQTANTEAVNLPAIINNAPDILMRSQERKSKAHESFLKISGLIEHYGMSDLYDGNLAKFIEKAKELNVSLNTERKPVTQMIDYIKKEFTKIESELKQLIDDAQSKRNAYATEKMNKKREEEQRAMRKLLKDKEIIEFRKACEISVSTFFSNCALLMKLKFLKHFDDLTLETVDKAGFGNATLSFDSCYPKGIEDISPTGMFINLTDNEKQSIKNEFLNADFSSYKDRFEKEIHLHLRELADRIPSKKAELQALSLADKEEAERLLKEKSDREKADIERIRLEEEKKKQDAEERASVKAAGEQASSLVDAQANVASAPKVVESFEIQVTSVAAYLMLAQFWFEKEGKDLPKDKFEKFTFARIKTFCEAYAKKHGEFVKSQMIIYEPVYKAK
jgi:23S rRNA pseudoU1915 N3-methylase RlmH